MAKDKFSFLIKHDCEHILDQLTYEQSGQLFKMLFNYSIRGQTNGVTDDTAVNIAFSMFRGFLDSDAAKYKATCETRSKIARDRHDKEKMQMMQMHANDANACK